MSELLALGISHKTAPVALRERLALTERAAERFMRELVAHDEVDEAVAISTCNRTEIYLVVGDPVARRGRAARPARHAAPASARPSSPTSSTRRATATPRASSSASTAGLESMIVGEAEVQGQVTPRLRGARSRPARPGR